MTQQFKIKFINKHRQESATAASSFRLGEGGFRRSKTGMASECRWVQDL